ncbi:MAG: DUF4105 domain-containing protein [Treponema sp.]|jgi:hypothetical protein|nr:DUF4105 domain-containing protein [Treponema sp.]
MAKKYLPIIVLLLVSCVPLFSQQAKRPSAPGENLTIKIAVIGPGSELYFWWGHIALVIEDSVTGQSRFYDYGVFSFENENFFYNFAFGRLLYSTAVSPSNRNIAIYEIKNRGIKMFTLDIPPESRIKVKDFAENNILPENRDYMYHHFKDNCCTRIRDIIDLAANGQFREQYGNAPSRFTLREHVRRHTWFSPPVDWILNFWMGQGIDTPITVWDDMFLPSEVGKRIEEFSYYDTNGVRRKLVSGVQTVYEAKNRPVVLDVPRKQWPRELAFSMALSAIFAFFFFLYARNISAGRVLAGVSMSLSGLVFGAASLTLYFLNLFTNHDYTYNNINMLFGTPLLLAAVPLGICYAAAKEKRKRVFYDALLRIIWLVCALGIFVSMLIKLFPQYWQRNLTDQMLMLPVALVFALQPVGLKEAVTRLIKRKGNNE